MAAPNLTELFVVEADELLVELETGLVALEENPRDPELINKVFRAAHTIKGGAGVADHGLIVEFTHTLESVLARLRDGSLPVSNQLITTLLKSVDVVKALVDRLRAGRALGHVEGYSQCRELLLLFANPSPRADAGTNAHIGSRGRAPGTSEAEGRAARATPPQKRIFEIGMRFRPELMQTGQDPALLVLELAELGEILGLDADASAVPPLADLDPTLLHIRWRVTLRTSEPQSTIENIFIFVVDENQIEIRDITATYRDGVDVSRADKRIGELLVEDGLVSPHDVQQALASQRQLGQLLVEHGKLTPQSLDRALSRQQAARDVKARSSLRVDTEKLDKLVNLVGELVTGVSQVSAIAHEAGAAQGLTEQIGRLIGSVEALDQISRDMQELVMRVRMVPIDGTFSGFKRVVRDLAATLGKQVDLRIEGAETELDKNVIDQMSDPLKHLVRNCVDHGIESPAERAAAGKSQTGTVSLRAQQREGKILIEVSDDGRGIDAKAVLAKAREQGLVTDCSELTDREICELVFHPGLSTAAEVTDISGRGVGMDVVRRNIEQLRGTIEVESIPGRGTTFRVRLPLTLAIIEGMGVRVGAQVLTIPLLSIVEQIRPRPQELQRIEGTGEVINVRGECLPLVRLHELFGMATECTDPTRALVVVIENDGRKFGLLVDTVLGQNQAVIKSLEDNYRKIDGVSGATILGDGTISLILDPYRIEQMALH